MGEHRVLVDQREDRAGEERAEDHLEAEVCRERDQADQENERAAHADLRRGVLQPLERPAEALECSRPGKREADQDGDDEEAAEQDQLRAVPDASREKKSDSRMTVAKSAIVAPAITSWPNVEPTSPASLSTGMTTPSEVAESTIATNSGWSSSAGRGRTPARARARTTGRSRAP